jgi:zinc protease
MRTARLLWIGGLGLGVLGLLGEGVRAQETAAQSNARAAMMPASAAKSVAPDGSPVGSVGASTSATGTSAPDAALPTTKALLARNDEVMGGAEALSKAATRRMKGLYQTEDGSTFFSIEIFQKTPNKSLFKITLPNGVVVRDVCDGHAAWVEDARGGYHQYEGAALASRLRYADFADRGKAFLLAATGKVTGEEKIGRHNTYVIEYKPEKNVVSRLYFDVESGFVVHTEDVYSTEDGPYTAKLDLDDYREVDGLKFPYRMKRSEKGVVLNIRLMQVSVNVPIEDAIFLKPESAPK